MQIPRLPLRWNWSWRFGLFIALPALVLALLGLRAVRAERIEREQQLREQQVQITRLIDVAVSNRMVSLEAELRPSETQNAEASENVFVFSLDRNNLLKFPKRRVYFGEQSTLEWPANVENLIEQAQAAKAQSRRADALAYYRRISEVEPKLRAWAELNISAVNYDAGEAGAFNQLAKGGYGPLHARWEHGNAGRCD